MNQLSLCDTIAPGANSSVQVSNLGAQFVAGPTNLQGLQFEWRRNDAIIAGATGTALTVFPHQLSLGAGPDTYSLTVSHETPLVRKEPIQDTFAWTLNSNEAELLEVWVKNDFAGTEAGTYDNPFNTAAEAVNRVSAGGNLVLRSNSRNVGEAVTISKPMTIDSRDTP